MSTLSGVTFWGLNLPWWVAVLAGGVVAAVLGVLVGPTAVRLRGLYLSLVTLALVFRGYQTIGTLDTDAMRFSEPVFDGSPEAGSRPEAATR